LDEGAVNGRFLSAKKAHIWTFPQLTPSDIIQAQSTGTGERKQEAADGGQG